MADDNEGTKERLARAIEAQKLLEKQLAQERQLAVEWRKKAWLAVKASNDGLAMQALQLQRDHELLALRYALDANSGAAVVAALRDAYVSQSATATLSAAVPSAGSSNSSGSESNREDRGDVATRARVPDADIEAALARPWHAQRALRELKAEMGIAERERFYDDNNDPPFGNLAVALAGALSRKKRNDEN